MVPHIPYRLRAERPSISFEFFPPKDDGSEAQLWEAIRHLERIRPDFVSVTYGAGGTTQDRTIRVTERIARETSLSHADELVELIRGLGDFTIGVAAFPDIHPSSPGLDHDIEVLVRKADAGASFAVTQMVFDADTYLRLRDAVAARRDLPVTPGLMPVTNLRQIQRMSQLMGTPLRPRCAQWVWRSPRSWLSGCSARARRGCTSSR